MLPATQSNTQSSRSVWEAGVLTGPAASTPGQLAEHCDRCYVWAGLPEESRHPDPALPAGSLAAAQRTRAPAPLLPRQTRPVVRGEHHLHMTAQHGRAALLTRVLSVWPSAATAACSSPTAQSSSDRESPKVPRAETLRWAGPANWPGVVQYYSELGLWRHLGVVRVVEGEVEEVVLVVTSCSLNSKSLNCCYEVVCTHLYELDALLDV